MRQFGLLFFAILVYFGCSSSPSVVSLTPANPAPSSNEKKEAEISLPQPELEKSPLPKKEEKEIPSSSLSKKALLEQMVVKEVEPVFLPGDVVKIDVFGEEGLNREIMVSTEGVVHYPLIKSFQIYGKTVKQLTQELTSKLSDYLVEPIVNISVVRFAERKVYLYGGSEQVSKTLLLSPYEQTTACHLLLNAGLPPDVDIDEIQVVRSNGAQRETFSVSLQNFLHKYDPAKDVIVQPGDWIVIQKSPQVYIYGSVVNPGAYPIQRGEKKNLWNALLLAKGPNNEADLDSIKILRKVGDTMEEIIASLPFSGNPDSVLVQADDIIIVPSQTKNFVTVYGEVKNAGVVTLSQKKEKLSMILAKAGGLGPYASNTISVVRYETQGGGKRFTINYKSILAGDPQHDIEIFPGDVIHVDAGLW